MKVKICGITNLEDAGKAVYYGAWAVGFVFYKKSPRYVSPSRAKKIIEELPPFVTPVGVFVNQKERAIRDVCKFARIHTIQLQGDEDVGFCRRFKENKIIKAFRVDKYFNVNSVKKFKVDAYLFDAYQEEAYGGTGKTFNWDVLKGEKFEKPVILSGGLNSENIQKALETVTPYAVDISSSLEKSPGIKDPRLIRAFFNSLDVKV